VGGVHRTYLASKIVYPCKMLIAILTKNGIGILPTIYTIIQILIYALMLAKKPKWQFYIVGIHTISGTVYLNLTT
jgi:hypothetical protein